ncbi:hypothetical protein [Halorubrum sp. PV6]|uniref:hypothetical protein n=1 Tax=Halorubrum sp. PV6 TaxID=634157 RepID=UPI000F85476C|nr:hypothetical protein [Halorubrum sp. PV6]AZQ14232.1 hypothetical protein DOS48_04950 [Halorubrum sp. PV6]
MQRTRRELLTVGAVAAGFSGCLSVEGVRYPDELPDENETDGTDGSDERPDGESSVPHSEIAAATRDIVTDTVWFATVYRKAIDTYRDATADILTAVSSIREQIRDPSDPATEMVTRLETVSYEAAERAAAALEPHFFPRELIQSRIDSHLPALFRSARRNDADRFVEELNRVSRTISQIRTPIYINGTFSRDPIHNRLLDRLAPSNASEVLVELAVPAHRFTTVAHRPYTDDDRFPPEFTAEPLAQTRRDKLRKRLGPVVQAPNRVREVFYTVAPRPSATDRAADAFSGSPGDLDVVPIYVQQYADVDAAADTMETVLEAGETDGQEPLLPETEAADDAARWYRYYHREARSDRTDLDRFPGVQYGYFLQAGEFLLATGFSGDAWEERPRWQGRLSDVWVTI